MRPSRGAPIGGRRARQARWPGTPLALIRTRAALVIALIIGGALGVIAAFATDHRVLAGLTGLTGLAAGALIGILLGTVVARRLRRRNRLIQAVAFGAAMLACIWGCPVTLLLAADALGLGIDAKVEKLKGPYLN